MEEFLTTEALSAFLQVIMIDLVLAGDNAVVIGLAAAGLPKEQRNKAILVGIIAATVLRIVFALLTTQLLQIVGLLLAGGILLLWVCWKMWRELRAGHAEKDLEAEEALGGSRPRRGRADRRACSAQDLQTGGLADRGRRRVHVARQRARRGGRRTGSPGHPCLRPWDCRSP